MTSLLSPEEISKKVVDICEKKAALPFITMLVLGILAGLYIGFGAEVYLMVSHDLAKRFGIGFMRFLRGSVRFVTYKDNYMLATKTMLTHNRKENIVYNLKLP